MLLIDFLKQTRGNSFDMSHVASEFPIHKESSWVVQQHFLIRIHERSQIVFFFFLS